MHVLEICECVEEIDSSEVFGPQIILDLGKGSSIHDVEPSVEAAGVAPTVVVEVEEESSVELREARASVEKMVGDQAEGTGSTPVLETIEKELGDQAVEAGGEPAHETVEERTGDEPVLMDVEEARTGVEPVLEAEELRIGKAPVLEDVAMGTGISLFMTWGWVILTLRIALEMILRKLGSTLLKKLPNHPQPLLLNNLLKKPLLVLNPGRRGSKL